MSELNFDASNGKEYKVKAIQNSIVYASKIKKYPLSIYYLVIWKKYLKEKNI